MSLDQRCCEPKADTLRVSPAYRRAMWLVIAINGAMFVVETAAGWLADSVALEADALDFAADTATYAISLFVLSRPPRMRALAAQFKGFAMAAMACWVLGLALVQYFGDAVPDASVMGAVGITALAANALSVWILFRFRAGDANMRSVWLCSRNDMIGNAAVIAAAIAVAVVNETWPDLAVAVAMAALFLAGAISIVRQAAGELRNGAPALRDGPAITRF